MSRAASGRGGLVSAFRVVLRRTGRTVHVAQDESVLEALLDAGIRVDSMCHNGLCGTCQTRVLAGEIDHRDTFLTDEQQARSDHMMICVSRSVNGADVVLDL